jgi:hypothetical protein
MTSGVPPVTNEHLTIGLSSWIICDGNYPDFSRGGQVSFALEFHASDGWTFMEPGLGRVKALERMYTCHYHAVAEVIYVRDDWWAIDAGVRLYRHEKPPREMEPGWWMSADVFVGIDPFHYIQRHSRHHAAPGLIYDWEIDRIELDTSPYIVRENGESMRDPLRRASRDIDRTNAGRDGGDYFLHCRRLDNPPRR